jgi:hypothetical protein
LTEKLTRDLADHINIQQAEIIVLRVTLQTLFIRMISANQDYAEEMLNDLKQSATGALARMDIAADTPERSTRAKALVKERATQFFDDISLALSQVRTKRGQSGRN